MNFAFYKAFCPALLLQGADGGSICCVHYRARRSGQEIKQTIDMEDPTVLPNLRALNLGQAAKFNSFWEQCARFMNEDVGAAVVFSPEFTGQRAQIISQDHAHHLECSDCQYQTLGACVPLSTKHFSSVQCSLSSIFRAQTVFKFK